MIPDINKIVVILEKFLRTNVVEGQRNLLYI